MRNLPIWWYRTEYFWIGKKATPRTTQCFMRPHPDYPHWQMPGQLKWYYLTQSAYWLQQFLVLVLKLEKPRSDFTELCIHHLVTLWLIGYVDSCGFESL